MPLKLGNGGTGLEEYNEHDGKYKTDGIPNKSYNNPEERILVSMGLENSLTSSLQKIVRESSIKSQNIENIKKILKTAPDNEYKELLLRFYKKTNCKIDVGNYPIDGYNPIKNVIELDYSILANGNSKVFFHENGHAIDENYGEKGKQFSDTFIGSDGLNLYDSIFEDWEQNGQEIYNYYQNFKDNFIKKEFEKKGLKYLSEKEQREKFDENKKNKIRDIEKLQNELILKFQRESRGLTKEQILQNKQFLELDIEFKKINKQKKEIENTFFEPVIPSNQETMLIVDSLEKVEKTFENISDVVSCMGDKLLTNIGHPKSYWIKDKSLRNSEFFANCFQSLISNNNDEINLYKKFFPKSYKVCNEILQELTTRQKGDELYEKFDI